MDRRSNIPRGESRLMMSCARATPKTVQKIATQRCHVKGFRNVNAPAEARLGSQLPQLAAVPVSLPDTAVPVSLVDAVA